MSNYQRWQNIMKCYPFEEKRLMKWEPPYIVQPKYDGFRCRAVPVQTSLTPTYLLLSSEENPFYSVPHLNKTFSDLMLSCELDGELYCHGMSFDQLSSILSRTVNLHDDFSKIKFHCFDIINEQPQLRRLLQIEALKGLHHYIEIAPFWICESLDEIMSVYDKLINSGYEGIIVRHKDGNYERKRSTMIMKFKPKKIDTYKIIGYEEEISIDGKPKDVLGSLWCSSGDGNQFSVGSGFTREQREQLWEIREELIGKEVIVSYQHLTSGKKKPRFPVFVDVLG